MAKHKNKIQLMKGEAGFHYLALVVMILLMLFCVVPLVLMLTVSLSSEASLVKGYRFIPSAWSLDAYLFMWAKRATILRAYGLTIVITIVTVIIVLLKKDMFFEKHHVGRLLEYTAEDRN